MIELNHLTKQFGDLVAVRDLTLTIPRGELFALLGPNAAGKTTTLRVVTGLIRPTAGRVSVAGFDVQRQPLEARRRLAYVPDVPFLYDKLTPAEFFRFIGQLFRLPDHQIENEARALTGRFGLEPFLDQSIESLSQGTRQRVTIVSALLHAPEVFVLDEPMVGLDPHHARVLKDLLKEQARRGVTVLISTHQLAVADELADRVGIMHRGRLIAVGTRDDLRRQTGQDGALEESFLALTSENAASPAAPENADTPGP